MKCWNPTPGSCPTRRSCWPSGLSSYSPVADAAKCVGRSSSLLLTAGVKGSDQNNIQSSSSGGSGHSSTASAAHSDIICAWRGSALAKGETTGGDDARMSCARADTQTPKRTHAWTHARQSSIAVCSRSSRVSGDLPQREVMSQRMMSHLKPRSRSLRTARKSADGRGK